MTPSKSPPKKSPKWYLFPYSARIIFQKLWFICKALQQSLRTQKGRRSKYLSFNPGEIDKNASLKQKEMILNLHTGFKGKYDEELKKAQEVEKEEEAKRRQVIEALQ